MSIYRKIKLGTFESLMALLFSLRERHPHIPMHPFVISEDVKRALAIDATGVILGISRRLSDRIMIDRLSTGLIQHKELFYLNEKPLPCVIESDYKLNDNWLTAENNYPLYFNLYKILVSRMDKVRMFEIGVRTGYQGVVCAKACKNMSSAFYMGVDPNLYVDKGLMLAGETLNVMRTLFRNFDFALIEGYSWERNIQKSFFYSGPFDIIHIDGDHSLQGKLIDLELARHLVAPEGLILVDDYDHHPVIKEAVKKSIAMGWFSEFIYIPTLRGLAILQ